MALMQTLLLVLTVKWGYPTDTQLNDLNVLTRGRPRFDGEADVVTAAETVEEFLARTKGYRQLLQLLGRDRDMSTQVLAGLGDQALNQRIKQVVETQLFSLSAAQRTPELLEQLIKDAAAAVRQSMEAARQAQLEEVARKMGLDGAYFETGGVAPAQPGSKPKAADMWPGLSQPTGGWGALWPLILKKKGYQPEQFCFTPLRVAGSCTQTLGATCRSQQLKLQMVPVASW